jgi:pimeloyl-ACP methyl ester carboxylesterase
VTFTAAHRGGSGTPLVCLHGFMETWRTWELVLPRLEQSHDVLAPTLAGHAGGPPLPRGVTTDAIVDEVERALDDAGFDTAHVVGNSLGGYLAFHLAARGRARSIVAFAPAGGWAAGDGAARWLLEYQRELHRLVVDSAAAADAMVATPEGRRQVTRRLTTRSDHIPAELLAHIIRGVAGCDANAMIDAALHEDWYPEPGRVGCPVRIVWGTSDQLLPWPSAATRYRREWFPHAEWIDVGGVGHCPQLDVPLEAAELVTGFTAR